VSVDPAATPVPADAVRPPVPTWVGPLFLVLAAVTVPWVLYLGLTLPDRSLARHYDIAWVGFDVMLVLALLSTGWLAARGRDHVELPAVATATLLVVDAWFDVLTSAGPAQMVVAVLSAVLVELPLAALCVWLVVHAEQVRTQRLRFFRRRARRSRRAAVPH
jgi:hypothetical protein